jgi:hypothetical protein
VAQLLSSKTLFTPKCPSATANRLYASDPVVNLAKHLMASQLNEAARACMTPDVAAKMVAAETLLDDLNYVGCKLGTAPTAAQTTSLRDLATFLDQYNNGLQGCGVCAGRSG